MKINHELLKDTSYKQYTRIKTADNINNII